MRGGGGGGGGGLGELTDRVCFSGIDILLVRLTLQVA